jgi:hypothetical protein
MKISGGNEECLSLNMGNFKFCQKLSKSAIEMFQKIKQAYSREALGHSAMLSGTNISHREETVWKMMSIPVSQKWSELN